MSFETLTESSPLLRDLPAGALEFLESVSTEVEFDKGEVIFEQDESATSFYLIDSGKVGLEMPFPARDPIVIETAGPGELLGVSWLFPPSRWSWAARALTKTRAVAFDANAVREECDRDSDLAIHVYRTVAEEAVRRLHATRVGALDLYPGPER